MYLSNKILRNLLILLSISLSLSCNSHLEGDSRNDTELGYGNLFLNLQELQIDHVIDSAYLHDGIDSRILSQPTQSMSLSGPVFPPLTDFTITVHDHLDCVVYSGKYTEAEAITLPIGNYAVKASCGTDVLLGFDVPYYAGGSNVEITQGGSTRCDLNVSLANAIVTPRYEEALLSQFRTYRTEVTCGDLSEYIEADDSRMLYVGADQTCKIAIVGVNAAGEEVRREVAEFITERGRRYVNDFRLLVPVFSMPEPNSGLAWSHMFEVTQVSAADFTQGSFKGYADRLRYEYSLDGTMWHQVPDDKCVMDVSSGTTYLLRGRIDMVPGDPLAGVVYSDNIVSVVTETPRQVPNGNMNDWEKVMWSEGSGSAKPRFRAWDAATAEADRWWATNNDRTVRYTIFKSEYNCFPAVSYVEAGRSGRGADLRTISGSGGGVNSVNSESPGNRTPGRLFIGDYTQTGGFQSNGETIVRGRPFSARPTAMKFYFKYEPWGTDARNGGDDEFRGYIELFNGEQSIGYGEYTHRTSGRQSVTAWTEAVVNVTYSKMDVAADKIVIDFVSTTADSPIVSTYWERTGAQHNSGSGSEYKNGCRGIDGHSYGKFWNYYGSVLQLDDIELIFNK